MSEADTVRGNAPQEYDPAVRDALAARVEDFSSKWKEWLAAGVTADNAGRLVDFLAAARKLSGEVEAARVEAKKVHDDRAKVVQKAYVPLGAVIDDTVIEGAKKMLSAHQDKLREEAEAKAAAEQKAAAEAEALATAQAEAASASGNVVDQAVADQAVADAKARAERAKAPVRVAIGSASGAGRTVSQSFRRVCTVIAALAAYKAVQDDPAVVEAVQKALDHKVNAKGWTDDMTIPGVQIAKRAVVR